MGRPLVALFVFKKAHPVVLCDKLKGVLSEVALEIRHRKQG
jgi:hypothetical protein